MGSKRPTRAAPPEAVAKRAYEIWEREGQPEGRSLEHWLRAEAELAPAPARTRATAGRAVKKKPAAAKKKATGAKKKTATKKKTAKAGTRSKRPRGAPPPSP